MAPLQENQQVLRFSELHYDLGQQPIVWSRWWPTSSMSTMARREERVLLQLRNRLRSVLVEMLI